MKPHIHPKSRNGRRVATVVASAALLASTAGLASAAGPGPTVAGPGTTAAGPGTTASTPKAASPRAVASTSVLLSQSMAQSTLGWPVQLTASVSAAGKAAAGAHVRMCRYPASTKAWACDFQTATTDGNGRYSWWEQPTTVTSYSVKVDLDSNYLPSDSNTAQVQAVRSKTFLMALSTTALTGPATYNSIVSAGILGLFWNQYGQPINNVGIQVCKLVKGNATDCLTVTSQSMLYQGMFLYPILFPKATTTYVVRYLGSSAGFPTQNMLGPVTVPVMPDIKLSAGTGSVAAEIQPAVKFKTALQIKNGNNWAFVKIADSSTDGKVTFTNLAKGTYRVGTFPTADGSLVVGLSKEIKLS